MPVTKIKIIFWGTPEFSLPSLETLIHHGYDVVTVITNPDEPAGRRQIITPPPAKVLAEKNHIPVFQPHTLVNANEKFEIPDADLFVVAAYGKIIPQKILELPRFGALNIHPSLLPRWRGPSPIQYTILSGDTQTGVTIIQMDEFMDHGPIVAERQLEISKINYTNLHDKLAYEGAQLLIKTIPQWLRHEITPIPQNDAKVTYSKKLTKDDGRINWSRPADEIERMIRAFNPWPGAWTIWPDNEHPWRIRIESADAVSDEISSGIEGLTWQNKEKTLLIQTGKGSLHVHSLTMESKRPMDAAAFLNGNPDIMWVTLI